MGSYIVGQPQNEPLHMMPAMLQYHIIAIDLLLITDPFPIIVSLLWPRVKLLGHLQCKHITSTTSFQAAAFLPALALKLPIS